MNKSDSVLGKKSAAKAVHKHEKAMHPGEKLTKLRAGGKAGVMPKMVGKRFSGRGG